jgi:hypothetical protein
MQGNERRRMLQDIRRLGHVGEKRVEEMHLFVDPAEIGYGPELIPDGIFHSSFFKEVREIIDFDDQRGVNRYGLERFGGGGWLMFGEEKKNDQDD